MNAFWSAVVLGIEAFLFVGFIVSNGFYIYTAIVALLRLPLAVRLSRIDPPRAGHSALTQPVSVIIPAFNEEASILRTVASLLAMQYGEYEVIVVNDGSTDKMMKVLTSAYELEPYPDSTRVSIKTEKVRQLLRSEKYPNLWVIDKEHGGKADALNAGVNFSSYPFIFAGDADSVYHPLMLEWMIEPFERNPVTVGVAGTVAVGDGTLPETEGLDFAPHLPGRMILRFQALEYLRSFLTSRMGWAPLNALAVVSGASGMWRRSVILEVGGYRTDTVWEDMEMTMRVHHFMRDNHRPYRIAFIPYPVCWTEAPGTAQSLFHQRYLWHRHLGEAMSIHRKMLWSSGILGMIMMPYYVFFEWLAPLVVTFGLAFAIVAASMHFLDWYSQWLLLAIALLLPTLVSIVSILLDEVSFAAYRMEDVWGLFFAAITENFGYRQYVSLAALAGFFAWMFRAPHAGKTPPGPLVKAYSIRR